MTSSIETPGEAHPKETQEKQLILVTGGARAGKSDFAQKLAQHLSLCPAQTGEGTGDGEKRQVIFVATAEALDAEMEDRIQRHRAGRPGEWLTIEEPVHLPEAISRASRGDEIVLVDCLNLWVSNLLLRGEGKEEAEIERETLDAARDLLECYQQGNATFVLVSNEVGLGLVPTHPLGRQFRDLLGKVNHLIAARSDETYLLVAGLPLALKALGSRTQLPWEGRPWESQA